jgi:hypothetical protein
MLWEGDTNEIEPLENWDRERKSELLKLLEPMVRLSHKLSSQTRKTQRNP